MFHYGHLLFTWKSHCGLKFYFGQFDRSEICTQVSFTSPELMQMLIIKLPDTEVKFHPKVKSQTGLSSLRVLCKRALSLNDDERKKLIDSIKTCAYETSKDLASEKEEIKYNKYNKTMQIMINIDAISKGYVKEHTPNWPQIPDYI